MSKMNDSLRLLLIDDNPDDRALTIRELKKEFEIQVEEIIDAEGFAHALEEGIFDIVITDYQLRWSNGLEILRKIKSVYPDCIVIMFTATGDEEIAVEAMKKGLDDYVLKSPKHFKRLPVAVKTAIKKAQQHQAVKQAQEELKVQAKILENMAEGVNLSDQYGVIFFTNRNFEAMFGYKQGELIGRNVSALNNFTPKDNARFVAEVMKQLKAKGNWFGEISNIKKDWNSIHHLCSCQRAGVVG